MNAYASNMSPTQISGYITKILDRNKGTADTSSVSKQLYDRFADIYYPTNMNWIFYTASVLAWNFNPELTANTDRRGSAYMMYTGSGAQGVTIKTMFGPSTGWEIQHHRILLLLRHACLSVLTK